MKYSELVGVVQGFQASINLEYDLNNIDKVKSYIPTEQSVGVLGDFLRSYYYKSEAQSRATVLIGPYGRGKSHLLLVLSALTSLDVQARTESERKHALEAQYELCDKIAKVNREVGALAKAVVDSKIRTLPVIINSNTTNINQSFLVAINEALQKAGMDNLLPTTYFDAAFDVIEKWESDFPNAIKTLKTELKGKKETVENLKIGLKQFDEKSYRQFCDCYPKIAAGAEFNPLYNMDVVKLYLDVANALQEQSPYCGITIVFDEFSKFLEANLDKSKMLNFKIIQDMAEAATRSKDTQLHFTCITHKDILDYSSSDSFKTVEGRFRKLRFVISSEQSYELIANAITKKSKFEKVYDTHLREFKHVADACAMTTLFSDLTQKVYDEKLVLGCFPLSPLSSFALLHVSELVGQNERTLFTFLAQGGSYTFRQYLSRDIEPLQWITVDYIYCYFEELFKKEVFNASVHSIWAKTDSAIRQVTDAAQISVLRSIAIINIIGDERIKPVPAHIKAALVMDDECFEKATRELLKRHILSQRDSLEYVLLTANGVDVQRSVDNFVKKSLTKINYCETLSRACDLGYVIPHAYNDKYGMLRCFKNIYMDAKAFVKCKNAKQFLLDNPYDGVIINIVETDPSIVDETIEKVRRFVDTPQVVICVSDQNISCEDNLKRYEAVRRLHEENDDAHFVEELEVFGEDLQRQIQSTVHIMFTPSSEHSSYWNCNGELKVSRQAELNHAISDICEDCYSKTPVINNEMVNKCSLNSQNAKGRDTVVAWILQHSESNTIPCMEGYGAEVSIFKAAFTQTGLDASATVADEGLNEVLRRIDDFITGSEKNRSNFLSLYHILTAPPYGMRRGVIPLYIAYVMRKYKESLVLYFKGKEIELSATVLSNLNDNPEEYELLVETGLSEKNKYLEEIAPLFEKYVDARSPSINQVYTVVKSMQNWMRSLPEYTKKYTQYFDHGEQKRISPDLDAVRSELMRFEINSRELLFDTWPKRLSKSGDLHECFMRILSVKEQMDSHLLVYRKELIKKVTALFIPGYQGSLSSSIMSWYKKLPDRTKAHVFDSSSNALIVVAQNMTSYDDDEVLNELVAEFASIQIEDWNDAMSETFMENVSNAIERINNYVASEATDSESGKLLISANGMKIEKTFASESISPMGETALNNLKSVFEEYNGSLEPDEQLAILAKLIGEIIQ